MRCAPWHAWLNLKRWRANFKVGGSGGGKGGGGGKSGGVIRAAWTAKQWHGQQKRWGSEG